VSIILERVKHPRVHSPLLCNQLSYDSIHKYTVYEALKRDFIRPDVECALSHREKTDGSILSPPPLYIKFCALNLDLQTNQT
jgi:hypothetical protein